MWKHSVILIVFLTLCITAWSQKNDSSSYSLVLPQHKGQLLWVADGFHIVESSVKPNGNEIGIRGTDANQNVSFLGFLFLFPEQAPMTSAKCRDGVMQPEQKANGTLKVWSSTEIQRPGGVPVEVVAYSTKPEKDKMFYAVRAFSAEGDICGDLEFYSSQPITPEDATIKRAFETFRLDQTYTPVFADVFLYAQVLYQRGMYKPAAPLFELALDKVSEQKVADATTMRRVLTDQAGMSYGMSGNLNKARAIFEKGISEDPDYPLYYYNLACADAEEKNLAGARKHLQEAFERKANVLRGEKMPNPTTDDSFLPFKKNKEFWTFVQGLTAD